MKRLSTILVLLCITHNLFAQRTKKNAAQSFLSVDIGVPIYTTTFAKFPIPLAIEWQRKKKRFGFGASIALEYDKTSWGDCTKRISVGTYLLERDTYQQGSLRWYCVSYQTLGIKPSIFGYYYLLENKKWRLWTKMGAIADLNILTHEEGEAYEVEIKNGAGTTIQVIKSEPIHISRNIETQGISVGLLNGLGANYALNKRTALRFTLQSELYGDYLGNPILFALGGVTFRI
jgi:hypothetical protein